MLTQDLTDILSINTEPRNKLEKHLISEIEHNSGWMLDTKLLSELKDYMSKTGFVLIGWSYMMWSEPIYSFENKKQAKLSLEYHSEHCMQPSLKGITYIEDLSKYRKF